MRFSDLGINNNELSNAAESEGFTPLEAGWYYTKITGCEPKETKSGTGMYLHMTYLVTGPKNAGRNIFENINIKNASDKAERIGKAQLYHLEDALGLLGVDNPDTNDLVGRAVEVRVALDPGKGEYGPSNSVKEYRAMANAPVSAMPAAAAAAQGTASAPAKKRPWA